MADPVEMRNYLALKKKSYAIKFDLANTNYTAIENIGTGAYGVVCSAVHNKTKQKVAIKKISGIFGQTTSCIAVRTYREIKILKHFKHDNVVAIREILHPGDDLDQFKDVYIVLDLMESDLHRIIHSKQELTEEHVRFFTYQILRGLKYVHSANVLHRDLKPSNLLVNENCDLKIGDFGMARGLSSNVEDHSMIMTHYVATRWYRAPELILSPHEQYNDGVDMWSLGCILAEMIGRKQLFPGTNHMDQLERILDKVGMPSLEYLKKTSTDTITRLTLGSGKSRHKGVSWYEVYPKASKKAIDLLSKILVLDPKKRITVNQALKHPFLSKYHDPDDEPICIPVFNFDFEKKSMNTAQVKTAILDEIMSYHKVKKRTPIQFDFRPVPKSELIQAPKKQFNFTPVPAEVLPGKSMTTDNKTQTNVEKNTTKNKSGSSSQNSSVSSKSDGSFERNHTELLQHLKDLQDLQEPSTVDKSCVVEDEIFKKPEGFPLSVKVEDGSKPVVMPKSSSDVEMWSAKSVGKGDVQQSLNVDIKPGDIIDIEMISAKSSGRDHGKCTDNHTQNNNSELSADKSNNLLESGTTTNRQPDTKELIRMALLSNERRKQRGDIPVKPKPMTAIQKQREREEKKRLKLEKARLKKKKDKKGKSPGVELTDEDRKLLEKWKNMQKPPSKGPNQSDSQPVLPTAQQGVDSVQGGVGTLVISTSAYTTTAQSGSLNQTTTQTSNIHTQQGSLNQMSSVMSDNISTVASTKHVLNTSVVTTGVGTVTTIQMPVGSTNPAVVTSSFSGVPASQITVGGASLPFGTYTEWSGPGPLPPRLPSYTEAVHAKTSGESTSHISTHNTLQDIHPNQPESRQTDSAAQIPWSCVDESSSGGLKMKPGTSKADWDMKIITKQLKQSNVEDLTLTHTPKGTGGGYGVACDLDLLMESAGAENLFLEKPDSAQLSPSLFTDWLDLTGNIDPKEFDTVLNEYMTSPISSQDLNNVMWSLMSPKHPQ